MAPAPVVTLVEVPSSKALVTGFDPPRAPIVESILRGLPARSIGGVTLAKSSAAFDADAESAARPVTQTTMTLTVETSSAGRDAISQTRATWHSILVASAVALSNHGVGDRPPDGVATVLSYPDGTSDTPTEVRPTWRFASPSPRVDFTTASLAHDLTAHAEAVGLHLTGMTLHPKTGLLAPEAILVADQAFLASPTADAAFADFVNAISAYGSPYLVELYDEAGNILVITAYSPILQVGTGYQRPGAVVMRQR